MIPSSPGPGFESSFVPHWELADTADHQIRVTVESDTGKTITVDFPPVVALALAGSIVSRFLQQAGPVSAVQRFDDMTISEFLEMMEKPGVAR